MDRCIENLSLGGVVKNKFYKCETSFDIQGKVKSLVSKINKFQTIKTADEIILDSLYHLDSNFILNYKIKHTFETVYICKSSKNNKNLIQSKIKEIKKTLNVKIYADTIIFIALHEYLKYKKKEIK